MAMVRIYKPNPPSVTVDSLMERYDRAKQKQDQSPTEERRPRSRSRGRHIDQGNAHGGDQRREPSRNREGERWARRREKLALLYQTVLSDTEKLAAPQCMWQRFPLFQVTDLSQWLPETTTEVCLALCTLGSPLDDHMSSLSSQDMSAAAALNEAALAWIVAITQELHQMVRDDVAEVGLSAGPAYRPGVGKWPLECQKIVFSHLPAHQIDVSLTDTCLMMPGLSTSLIIPIKPLL
ncbi:MAG: hypothetical protein AAF702_01210 [Chloroflexota bacterium]